jgi:uncharacterized protein (TIGR00730 family)
MKRVCVFCGSNNGSRQSYVDAAQMIGRTLVRRGIELVYGGGRIGLMGAVADSVLSNGGKVIGVIPEALVTKEVAHEGLSEQIVVSSMHERKAMMADLSDAFIALPGGYGTLEEFCEVLTWAQLGLHQKPCGILNVDGYYDKLLSFFDHSVTEGFVHSVYRSLVIEETGPERLLALLSNYRPPELERWIEREER